MPPNGQFSRWDAVANVCSYDRDFFGAGQRNWGTLVNASYNTDGTTSQFDPHPMSEAIDAKCRSNITKSVNLAPSEFRGEEAPEGSDTIELLRKAADLRTSAE
jgi:hypothetical protein